MNNYIRIAAVSTLLSGLILSGCVPSGGGDQGGGPSTGGVGAGTGGTSSSGSLQDGVESQTFQVSSTPVVHTFSSQAGVPIHISLAVQSGDPDIWVYESDPRLSPDMGIPLGYSGGMDLQPESVSVVPSITGLIYIQVTSYAPTSIYSISAKTTNLLVDGSALSAVDNRGVGVIFSFDGIQGQGYTISANYLSGGNWWYVYDGVPDGWTTSNIGSNNGTGSVIITPDSTGKVYIRAYGQSSAIAEMSFSVATTDTSADLSIAINSIVNNGTDFTVNYTITNTGLVAATNFDIQGWYDQVAAPSVGSYGDFTDTITGMVSPGGTYTRSITTTSPVEISGTAYLLVNTTGATPETDTLDNASVGMGWVEVIPESSLSIAVHEVIDTGTEFHIVYFVYNNGPEANVSSIDIQGWYDLVTPPVVGDMGDFSEVISVSIASGDVYSGRIVVSSPVQTSGTTYLLVNSTQGVLEVNTSDNVSSAIVWVETPPIITYSFENQQIPAEFISEGDAAWTIDATQGSSGTVSLMSGTILDNQLSCLVVTVDNSTAVSFDFMTSSELGWDYLRFYIDNTQQTGYTGTDAGWEVREVMATTTTGLHEFKWCYEKDASASSGSDAVWIDNIVIY